MARNILLNSSFAADTNADGTADNWSVASDKALNGTLTKSLVAGGQRIQYVAGVGDSAIRIWLISDLSPVGTLADGGSASLSVLLSGSATGCSVLSRIYANSAIGTALGNVAQAETLGAAHRTSLAYAVLPATTSRGTARIDIYPVDAGDSFDITIDDAKLEAASTATPYEPLVWPLPTIALGGGFTWR